MLWTVKINRNTETSGLEPCALALAVAVAAAAAVVGVVVVGCCCDGCCCLVLPLLLLLLLELEFCYKRGCARVPRLCDS